MLRQLTHQATGLADDDGPFAEGLYVSTEMFVNGMMHLIEQGIVKRKVYDNLLLQQGINAGRITSRVDGQLFDYARLSGLMPRRLDAPSLQELQYWGIIAAACLPRWRCIAGRRADPGQRRG